MTILRVCIRCATPSPESFCPTCKPDRSRYRRERLGLSGGAWSTLRRRVLKRDQGVCYLCDQITEEGDELHVDHLVALEDGGTNDLWNLATSHAECHRQRHRDPDWAAERVTAALRALGGVGTASSEARVNENRLGGDCAGAEQTEGGV